MRAFVDGAVATVLPAALLARGLGPSQIGVVITATLLGSAVLTLGIGMRGARMDRVRLLRLVAVLMAVTGVAFGVVDSVVALVGVALVGTINPSGGDVSVFLPLEQSLLPEIAGDRHRTRLFARYGLIASLAGACGSLAAVGPDLLVRTFGTSEDAAYRSVFLVYAASGVVVLWLYRGLRSRPVAATSASRSGLHRSRRVVYRLAALFSLDSLGSGFAGQAIIVLWLSLRHDMSTAAAGALFFWSGLLTAGSTLLAPWLADRIGLVRTMAYTHIPANLLLMAAAVVPTVELAVVCLLVRSILSRMDAPARQSYVMAVVDPDERTAAASFTNVPRSLAAALPPLAAGWLLARSDFGWPLLVAGGVKALYDVLLLVGFRNVRPPEEVPAT